MDRGVNMKPFEISVSDTKTWGHSTPIYLLHYLSLLMFQRHDHTIGSFSIIIENAIVNFKPPFW